MECRVDFDYDAQESDELSIKKGDIITNVEEKLEGWLEGFLNGKRGLFPDNFVTMIKGTPKQPEKSEPDVVLRKKNDNTRRLKVLFSYSPEQDDELQLEVGDEIEFMSEVEEGWWKGRLRGNVGIFPSNFVESSDSSMNGTPKANESGNSGKPKSRDSSNIGNRLSGSVPPDVLGGWSPKGKSPTDDSAPELPPKPVRELARCLYPYKAANDDELTLELGDTIVVLSKTCEDDGWWRGELKGKIGVFPDNFVEVISPDAKNKPQNQSLSHTQNTPAKTAALRKTPEDTFTSSKESRTEVDGIGSSKPKPGRLSAFKFNSVKKDREEPDEPEKDTNGDSSVFNSIERGDKLQHLTANRAKAPKRRPPSGLISKENEISGMNGSASLHESLLSTSNGHHQDTKPTLNDVSYKSLDLSSSSNHNTPPSREKETPNSTSNTASKRKVFLPFVGELKETQDKKKATSSPTGPAVDILKNVSNQSPSGHNAFANSTTPASLPVKEKPAIPTSRAPPLPTKPTLFSSTSNNSSHDSTDKSPTNSGPIFPGGVKLKKVGSTPGQPGSIISPSKEIPSSLNHQGPGGDMANKRYVTFEEYSKMKDRVVNLENEVENLKKMVQKLLDKPKGQIL